MFDIGFWELGIIGLVALVVIGPERLPGVARTVGKWVGAMQRFVGSVKADIDSEINKHEDLKELIDEQKELQETHEILENTISDLNEASSIPSSIATDISSAEESTAAVSGDTKAGSAETGADNKQSHG